MHEDPDVENRGSPGRGLDLHVRRGAGHRADAHRRRRDDVRQLADGWTVVTADGSLASHAEHTVLVGDHGPEILTSA